MAAWQHEHVKSFREIDYFYRIIRGEVSRKRVLLSQITGTFHSRYAGDNTSERYTWLQMQANLKKASPQYRERYIGYYDPDKEHDGMGLYQYGQDYLISGGNNRICTWKFAGKESIMVTVQEYVFDHALYAAWHQLQEWGIAIRRHDEQADEPDGNWTLYLGELKLVCETRGEVLSFVATYNSLTSTGLARVWLRIRYKQHLRLQPEQKVLFWRPGMTEQLGWFQSIYTPYLLAYKMQQAKK